MNEILNKDLERLRQSYIKRINELKTEMNVNYFSELSEIQEKLRTTHNLKPSAVIKLKAEEKSIQRKIKYATDNTDRLTRQRLEFIQALIELNNIIWNCQFNGINRSSGNETPQP